jgi:hypothetical protein
MVVASSVVPLSLVIVSAAAGKSRLPARSMVNAALARWTGRRVNTNLQFEGSALSTDGERIGSKREGRIERCCFDLA